MDSSPIITAPASHLSPAPSLAKFNACYLIFILISARLSQSDVTGVFFSNIVSFLYGSGFSTCFLHQFFNTFLSVSLLSVFIDCSSWFFFILNMLLLLEVPPAPLPLFSTGHYFPGLIWEADNTIPEVLNQTNCWTRGFVGKLWNLSGTTQDFFFFFPESFLRKKFLRDQQCWCFMSFQDGVHLFRAKIGLWVQSVDCYRSDQYLDIALMSRLETENVLKVTLVV